MANGAIRKPFRGWRDSGLSTTGTGSLDISGLDFDELCVIVSYSDNPAVFIIPKMTLTSSLAYFRVGSGGSTGQSASYILTASMSAVALFQVTIGGTTYTNNSTVKVYYR